MSKPANPYLRDASDRQLLAEFRRREHISTNTLLRLVMARYDVAAFVGRQFHSEEDDQTKKVFHMAADCDPEAVDQFQDAMASWLSVYPAFKDDEETPPATDGGAAEDEE